MSIAQSLLFPPPLEIRSTGPTRRRDASSRAGLRSSSAGGPPSLHVLLDSPVQSAVLVLRAICSTKDPVVVVALVRDPELYSNLVFSDLHSCQAIHSPLWGNPYHAISALPGPRTIPALLDQIQSQLALVRQAKPGARTTVVFDSLQPVLDDPSDGVRGAVRLVQGVLALLLTPFTNPSTNVPQASDGRVVVTLSPDSDLSSRTATFVAALQSPSLWSGLLPTEATSSSGGQGTTSISYLLPSEFAKVVQDDYAQRLPLTSSASSSRSEKGNKDQEDAPDPRVWPLLGALTSRGILGRREQPGWWASLSPQSRPRLEPIRALHRKSQLLGEPNAGAHPITALLMSFSRSGQGKSAEEVVGISVSANDGSSEELLVVPLTHEVLNELQPPPVGVNMTALTPVHGLNASMTSPSSGRETQGGDTHAALLAGLPFNLNETASQRAQRAQVVLPHQAAQHVAQQALTTSQTSVPGRGSIVFHPEDVDDADEEELDDEDEEI